MSTELSNGVIIPEEYSDDWYDEMSINLRKLNDVITAASDNATDIQRLDTAKANQTDLTALSGRVSQNETDITALQTAVSGALKREIVQSLPTQDISTTTIYMIRNTTTSGDNIYDEYMYINSQLELIGTSATDFSNYYTKTEIDTLLSGKQASLSQTQLDAVNSGIDSSKVQQIATNTSDISSLQSGKADDNSVVHKSGDETISGNKTFSSINGVAPSSLSLPDLNNRIDISSYITNLDKRVNQYTPPSNGWLSIRVKKTSLIHTSLMIYQPGGLLSSCETDEYSISGTNLPVIANQNVEIYVYADVLVEAKFYPCQGNV